MKITDFNKDNLIVLWIVLSLVFICSFAYNISNPTNIWINDIITIKENQTKILELLKDQEKINDNSRRCYNKILEVNSKLWK